MDLTEKNKLLYARAGFGISPAALADPMPVGQLVNQLLTQGKPAPLLVVDLDEWHSYSSLLKASMNNDMEKQELRKQFRERTKDLNRAWIKQMATTNDPLQEKMALFWHGHFAAHIDNPFHGQQLLDVIRQNALGNFGDLLTGISKSPAMLQFLNNRQNKKQHPNENFAREVMELFTLGRGHYTEDDVKEAARAFTGWNFDGDGKFIFHYGQHDDDSKKILGQTGNFDGDDVLRILLQQKQTSVFITQKIYRYFVSDERTDERHVKHLAATFYDSNYDISALLREIFNAGWFYESGNVAAKIKSPIELLVGYQRLLPMQFDKETTIIYLQRVLGQVLFEPPNVAGWPGGKNWIDSSTLVLRMRLPEALLGTSELNLEAKDNEQELTEMHSTDSHNAKHGQHFRVGAVDADWTNYIEHFNTCATTNLPDAIAHMLLPRQPDPEQIKSIERFADKDTREQYIKSLTILIMGLPEYQLC